MPIHVHHLLMCQDSGERSRAQGPSCLIDTRHIAKRPIGPCVTNDKTELPPIDAFLKTVASKHTQSQHVSMLSGVV